MNLATARHCLALLAALGATLTAGEIAVGGEIQLASLFGDQMVLQRDQPVPVWGWAQPGETIQVQFADQEVSTQAGDNGRWQLTLKPMPASAAAPIRSP